VAAAAEVDPSGPAEPLSQAYPFKTALMHVVEPFVAVYMPLGQGEHVAAAADDDAMGPKVPGPQTWPAQLLRPVALANVPGGQNLHWT
jgi:hypothetical protein